MIKMHPFVTLLNPSVCSSEETQRSLCKSQDEESNYVVSRDLPEAYAAFLDILLEAQEGF